MVSRINLVFFLLLLSQSFIYSQIDYTANQKNPFGVLNPNAPKETADYEKLIGVSDCISTKRKADRTWEAPQQMTWTFKYIMNGMTVQDETIKEDGSHSGSIRQFVADSSKWYVHWYSSSNPTTKLSTWEGGKKGEDIVLYNKQKAPNGMDGFFRLTFKNITQNGFEWIGEWTDLTENIVFPTWKIECTKKSNNR